VALGVRAAHDGTAAPRMVDRKADADMLQPRSTSHVLAQQSRDARTFLLGSGGAGMLVPGKHMNSQHGAASSSRDSMTSYCARKPAGSSAARRRLTACVSAAWSGLILLSGANANPEMPIVKTPLPSLLQLAQPRE
jgi:hypothetical protein